MVTVSGLKNNNTHIHNQYNNKPKLKLTLMARAALEIGLLPTG